MELKTKLKQLHGKAQADMKAKRKREAVEKEKWKEQRKAEAQIAWKGHWGIFEKQMEDTAQEGKRLCEYVLECEADYPYFIEIQLKLYQKAEKEGLAPACFQGTELLFDDPDTGRVYSKYRRKVVVGW